MADELDGQTADAEQALAAGASQRVGSFRFYFDDQRWEWSEQVQRMHGYEPGTVTPTTELVLSHKHPDDRRQVAATIDNILHTRLPFSTRHRILDTGGTVHHVVVVGDQLIGERGAVIGTHGYYVDITPTSDRTGEDFITAKVAEITGQRSIIEQAKGMLMLVYGIDADAAFGLLKWRSQESNIKLRLLAQQVAADFCAASRDGIPSRSMFDHLLLTAHERAARLPDEPARTMSS
ncbi:putative transcription antitermination regulator [Mycobacterium sp. MFM001]|uniref:PAS and ANTAR domain-containing protein n=1 Tax=Mycobacterium sp. MFM001 TaxID=2049453 RepID=UPI000DA56008|nr:PAS and ANTAR domain-containing protein [Mycobacterium sp. MFM001]GBE66352.1 putative transcription antitermination regulator [Mycobacterium sp. MFM001]